MYSGPKEMDKRINNDLENITQKSKHRTTSTPLKPDFSLEDNNTLVKKTTLENINSISGRGWYTGIKIKSNVVNLDSQD
jgi:hypothetical protein